MMAEVTAISATCAGERDVLRKRRPQNQSVTVSHEHEAISASGHHPTATPTSARSSEPALA